MEHVSNRSTLRGNVVYTDHYVSTFLRRYFLRRYSFPYDESKGIDARNIIGGERNHDVFTRITVSRWEFRFLSGSNILITSNLIDFHARFFAPLESDSEDLSTGMRGKNILLARISTRAAHKNKMHIFLVERFISPACSTYSTLRKSVNHPRGKLARLGTDEVERETRLTVAEEPSRVCGGNEGVDISARAP